MSAWQNDPFELAFVEDEAGEFSELTRREVASPRAAAGVTGAATARLHGFDPDDRPLVVGLPGLSHEVVTARATVALLRQHVGSTVVIVFEAGDVRRPIILGVMHDARSNAPAAQPPAAVVSAQIDDQRLVLTAEREVVLRCGDASITLTRAGKVLIKGTYVLSRSSGYNKIKGAAVDIN